MIDLVDEKYRQEIKLGLITNGDYFSVEGKPQTWETHHFYYTILTAAIVILNKTITEIYNTEFDVVNNLFDAIDAEDFKYDIIAAKVLPKSDYVYVGNEYNAEIIVAAYDTSKSHEVYLLQGVNYLSAEQYERAMLLDSKPEEIKINFTARSEGIKKYAGFVRTKTSSGTVNDYHFNGEYMVAKPSCAISAKKMNVFYIGVDNPVSIAISGIPKENLIASISCGTIKRDPFNNDWIVNIPGEFTDAIINISANINGVKREIGSEKFRVKSLPDPIVTIADKNSGVISKEVIVSAGTLLPKMQDDFEFDYSFMIRSFTMNTQRGFNVYSFNSSNTNLTVEMKNEIKLANRGQKVVFENIIVSDPSAHERSLSPIVLIVN